MAISLRLSRKDAGAAKSGARPDEKPPLREVTPVATARQSDPKIGRDRKILVVDDNPIVLKAFEIKLKASGFSVTTTEDGSSVARTAEETKPDLIILDINFPVDGGSMEWTGFSIVQWLRRFPELEKIPIIMMTGTNAKAHQEQARAAGAVALFQKPVEYGEMLPAILNALGDPLAPAAEEPPKG
jgi:two-component system KDP operon response regulator KdpE